MKHILDPCCHLASKTFNSFIPISPGINFTNFYEELFHTKIFCAAFMCLQFGFEIFWWNDFGATAAHKMLVKLAPGVNFTNIFWAAFTPKSFCQKIPNPNCKQLKAVQRTLVWLSISPIFYKQFFHTKVLCSPFMCLPFGFVIFWRKDFGAKAAHKMLVKLTPGCHITEVIRTF
jgi:hypothetical protein